MMKSTKKDRMGKSNVHDSLIIIYLWEVKKVQKHSRLHINTFINPRICILSYNKIIAKKFKSPHNTHLFLHTAIDSNPLDDNYTNETN